MEVDPISTSVEGVIFVLEFDEFTFNYSHQVHKNICIHGNIPFQTSNKKKAGTGKL